MLKHKKIIIAGIALLAILAFGPNEGWHVTQALAQGTDSTTTPTTNIFSGIINVAVIITTAMEVLAFLIFTFLQALLDPLFILEVNETGALQNIWQYSRDIVNVIFAFLLIFAGIYTVVTGQKELVQQKYKKYILAVILVNFSWFFPRVILDTANVLTATIYELPAGLAARSDTAVCRTYDDKPCRVITDMLWGPDDCKDPPDGYISKYGILCYKTGPWRADTNTSYGMLNGLVVNYGMLPDLTRVLNPGKSSTATTTEDRLMELLTFLIHIIFVFVIMTMLFLPLAAMLVVFLIRIPIMWFTIAFMPFMFVGFVIGDKMGQFNTMKIFEHYVKAAFLPTVIAVPFSVGFMIITEFMNTTKDCEKMKVINAAGFCKDTGPFLIHIDTFWKLLIMLMTLIVIWAGFWMALKIDDIYVNATSGIKSFGETLGKTALKLPFSVPFIPVGNGQKASILGVDDILRRKSAELSAGNLTRPEKDSGDGGAATDTQFDNLRDAINDNTSKTNSALRTIADNTATNNGGTTELKTAIQAQLDLQGSDLNRKLRSNGIDPRTQTADEILRNMESTTDSALRDVINEIKANDNQNP